MTVCRLACAILAGIAAVASGQDGVSIAFPREGARLPGITNVYCIGAVPTNAVATLTINGATTEVYRTGAFLAMVPMVSGTNRIVAVWGTNVFVRTVTVAQPEPPQQAATGTVVQPKSTHDPYADLGIPTNAVFAASPPYGRQPSDVYIMVDAGDR